MSSAAGGDDDIEEIDGEFILSRSAGGHRIELALQSARPLSSDEYLAALRQFVDSFADQPDDVFVVFDGDPSSRH